MLHLRAWEVLKPQAQCGDAIEGVWRSLGFQTMIEEMEGALFAGSEA